MFKKLLITLSAIAVLVFGSLQLGNIEMATPKGLCGEWG